LYFSKDLKIDFQKELSNEDIRKWLKVADEKMSDKDRIELFAGGDECSQPERALEKFNPQEYAADVLVLRSANLLYKVLGV